MPETNFREIKEGLQAAISILETLEKSTGLTVSFDKSKIFRVGNLKHSNKSVKLSKDLVWSDDDIEMLGITITNNRYQTNEAFHEVIDKMENIMQIWYMRNLTLSGKVLIINTLMASLFVYKMSVLPIMSDQQFSRIYGIIHRFLWKGGKAKIPLNVLQKPKKNGGLGLVDFEAKHKALHAQWITKIVDDVDHANYVYRKLGTNLGPFTWDCNTHGLDIKNVVPDECNFWTKVWQYWAEAKCAKADLTEDLMEQVLWFNSDIRIGGSMLRPTEHLQNGLWKVEHLFDENTEFLTKHQFVDKFGEIHWLLYYQIRAAVCDVIKGKNGEEYTNNIEYSVLMDKQRVSNIIYSTYIQSKENTLIRYYHRWKEKINPECVYKEYIRLFRNIYCITNITKFRDFQYRLLLGKIFTNDTLVKWGIVDSQLCNFCNIEKQTNLHLLYGCTFVKKIWVSIGAYYMPEVVISSTAIMENNVNKKSLHVHNFIVLVTKQYIFRCKCENVKPKFETLQAELRLWKKIEEYNAKLNSRLEKHKNKWQNAII